MKLTLEEFVIRFGTEKQVENYLNIEPNKKGERNVAANVLNSIVKSAKTSWENIEIEGKGAKRIFTLSGEYIAKKEKETKYKNCGGKGGKQLVGSIPLKSIICGLMLSESMTSESEVRARTLGEWASACGCLPEDINRMRFGRNEHLRAPYIKYIENFLEKNKMSSICYAEDILNEFIDRISEHAISQIKKASDQMEKSKIIKKVQQFQGVTHNGETKNLSPEEAVEIINKKTKLMGEFGIDNSKLILRGLENVRDFYEKFELYLKNEYNIKYYYEAFYFVFNNSKQSAQKYYVKVIKQHDLVNMLSADGNIDFDILIEKMDEYLELTVVNQLNLANNRNKSVNESDSWSVRHLKENKMMVPLSNELFKAAGMTGKDYHSSMDLKDIEKNNTKYSNFNKKITCPLTDQETEMDQDDFLLSREIQHGEIPSYN